MRQKTRNRKINDNVAKTVKEKFIETEQQASKLEVLNNNQKLLVRYLREGRQVVFAQGSAGCGKSYVVAHHCANMLKQKKIDKVLLVRANVSVGKSLGMLPGSLEEKLAPFFVQTIEHLKHFLGNGFTNYCLENKTIMMQSIEHMRGMSVENALIFVEESQNLTKEEIEMLLTRIGNNTQMVFTGDEKQSDLKGNNGMGATIQILRNAIEQEYNFLDNEDLKQLDSNIGIVSFTPKDVVRSGICKSMVKLYYYQSNK